MSKEVATKQDAAIVPITNPLELLQTAIDKGVDPGALEKLMDLAERHDRAVATKEFDSAMAKFQAQCPAIPRTKDAGGRWKYAPLEHVHRIIQAHLEEHGFSYRFDTDAASDGYLRVVCTVAHKSGHKETSHLTVPVDSRMSANDSQKQGSANSYAKRYALSNALGLVYCDEDDDGAGAGSHTIDASQAANIEALITEVGADKVKLLRWAGVETLEEIPDGKYRDCVSFLERKRGQ